MNYNYHTHTFRCHHATSTPEEYVKRAIDNGILYMGFSEHIPLVFPDGYESRYRMTYSECNDYIDEITFLKEKYKNVIDIKIGFEMEYYPNFFEQMYETAIKSKAEYLLLGQHFIYSSPTNHEGTYSGVENNCADDLNEYVKCVIDAMDKGIFTYVAHPDVFNYTGDEKTYKESMEQICLKSKETYIPLEINFWGIKNKRYYPNKTFWEIAGKTKCPVVFGCDSHDLQSSYDDISLEVAKKMVKEFDLNYIGMPKLIPIK